MRSTIVIFFLVFTLSAHCQFNFYFGNIHAHTSYSDGNKDSASSGCFYPGQDFYFAKSSYHMDYLGISEHNHYNATNNPGMHVADYSKGLYQADTANVEGSFVCMFGFEWGVISGGGHVVTYGMPSLIGWETGTGAWGSTNNYDIFCAKSDYISFWPIINSYPTAFCTLAHPQSLDYNDLLGTLAYSAIADNAIAGVAIRSGSAMSLTTDYSDVAPTLYESSYLKALARGYHMGPTADHDNHYTTFGRTNHTRTVALATTLKRDSIMSAYKAMRYYASDDWDAEVNFTINGSCMGTSINTNLNSTVSVNIVDVMNNVGAADPINKIELYYGIPGSGFNATILSSNTGTNTLTYVHPTAIGDEFYYFVKITETDGDIIWTSPIWVTRTLTIIPIDLISFSGKEIKEGIGLTWATAQELAVNYFEVERSLDGQHFSSIGRVASAHQNSSIRTDYEMIDKQPAAGLNYYRLKEVDITGRIIYSNIIAINKYIPQLLVSVYPNPVHGLLSVKCTAPSDLLILAKIYNSDGHEIKTFSGQIMAGQSILKTSVADLPAGLYFLNLFDNGKRIGETVFIKK
ncbi:MAG: T9SS type A sorting domain-containing protein [Chitinophagaceae bacterium]